jgi:[ribosomal protein S18]-alanine N-acetyltransferase
MTWSTKSSRGCRPLRANLAVVDIRRVTEVDDVLAASAHFDAPARREWAATFLAAPNHHLFVAYVDGVPAGMVTGVEMTMPDKGTEMFLYELAVGEQYRRAGIGRALTDALAAVAVAHGCYGMWVLTDHDNDAAVATYRGSGAGEFTPTTMLTWTFAGH